MQQPNRKVLKIVDEAETAYNMLKALACWDSHAFNLHKHPTAIC
jgi:hypothetical protein